MANNEIGGIDGIGARGNVQPAISQPTGHAHTHAHHSSPSHPPPNTHDVTHFSPDVDELSGTQGASAPQSSLGNTGIFAGNTITPSGVSNAPSGIFGGGTIISGQSSQNTLVPAR